MSDQTIVEISANRLVLARVVSGTRTPAFNFVTPDNWRKGDPITMRIKCSPTTFLMTIRATLWSRYPRSLPTNGNESFTR